MRLGQLKRSLLPEPVDYFSDMPWLQRAKKNFGLDLTPADLRDAAVLVPLIKRDSGWCLILTRRNDSLRHHAGQVSFPGGAAETQDAGAVQTAIREAEEEIGIPPAQIEVIGCLPEHPVISGFSVTPVVAVVEMPVRYRLDRNEVAEVFELPWSIAAKPSNHQLRSRIIGGVVREIFAFQYRSYDVWGATAAMIVDLAQRYLAQQQVPRVSVDGPGSEEC